MPPKGWAYYSSAADDEITHRENHLAYHAFGPAAYPSGCETVDFSTTILGQKTGMPIYITATALGKLGHRMESSTSLVPRQQKTLSKWCERTKLPGPSGIYNPCLLDSIMGNV